MPQLKRGGPVRWIGTKFQLKRAKAKLGLDNHFYYTVPGTGFTLGQYLLGRTSGAKPVAPAVQLTRPDEMGNVKAGDLLEVSYGNSQADWDRGLALVTSELHSSGIRLVPVTVLFSSSD